MTLLIIIIIVFIVYGLIGEQNDASKGKSSSRTKQTDDDVSAYVRSLENQFVAAYNASDKEALKIIVEDMVGYHYSSYYAANWDDCMLLESLTVKYPYTYNGSREDCKGLSLLDIFRNQNAYIMQLKNNK